MRTASPAMRRAARGTACVAVLALSFAAPYAQSEKAFEIKVAPVTVTPGEMGEAVITLVIDKEYRILGNPLPNKYSQALSVTFDATRTLQPRTAIIPEPKEFTEHPQTFSYHAYDGSTVVKMPFKVDEHAPAGDHTMHGRIRYQALIIDDDGLAGFLKTAVKIVDVTVHVAPRREQAPAAPSATRP